MFHVLVYNDLQATGLFDQMSISTDEDEHSLEMHLPYIAKVMERFTALHWSINAALIVSCHVEYGYWCYILC